MTYKIQLIRAMSNGFKQMTNDFSTWMFLTQKQLIKFKNKKFKKIYILQ